MTPAPHLTSSHLEREIREQPAVIARLLAQGRDEISDVARALRGREPRYLLIAARGTSANAARYAQYLFGERMKLPVALAAPSLESLYAADAVPHERQALVIGISQSGRSPDVVSVVTAARARGAPTIALTNEIESPLARAAELTIPLHAGLERSVAATKTYTASLVALASLVAELRDDQHDRAALRQVPDELHTTLDNAFGSVQLLDDCQPAPHIVTVGRGYNYATALEIALKIRELTATVAEGFSSADLMHGPIAAIAPGVPALIVAAQGRALASVTETAEALRRRGARTITIGPAASADLALPAGIPEWLSPIVSVAAGQILALRWAEIGGHPIDQPPSLTKITETT